MADVGFAVKDADIGFPAEVADRGFADDRFPDFGVGGIGGRPPLPRPLRMDRVSLSRC